MIINLWPGLSLIKLSQFPLDNNLIDSAAGTSGSIVWTVLLTSLYKSEFLESGSNVDNCESDILGILSSNFLGMKDNLHQDNCSIIINKHLVVKSSVKYYHLYFDSMFTLWQTHLKKFKISLITHQDVSA